MESKVYNKYKERIDSYQMKGSVLKKVSEDITPYLAGILEGMLCDVRNENHAEVFRLHDDKGEKLLMAEPFLRWTSEEVSVFNGQNLGVEALIPEGRSRGIYVTKTGGRILCPLMA